MKKLTKKIFKSTMLVCALVLAVGLAAVMGILYNDFDLSLIHI